METSDKWNLVEAKMAELRLVTDEAWKKEQWEIAALGERVLRACEQSRNCTEMMMLKMGDLKHEVTELKVEAWKRGLI